MEITCHVSWHKSGFRSNILLISSFVLTQLSLQLPSFFHPFFLFSHFFLYIFLNSFDLFLSFIMVDDSGKEGD